MPEFDYSVDDEKFETEKHKLTPREILTNAGYDASAFYLIQIEGDHDISYKDKLDDEIELHNHMKFITAKLGPTPVSG